MFELAGKKIPQAPIALRAAGKSIGRKRAPFAPEHSLRRRDQPVDRDLIAVVVAADEIVFRQAGPFDGGWGKARRQQRREIE